MRSWRSLNYAKIRIIKRVFLILNKALSNSLISITKCLHIHSGGHIRRHHWVNILNHKELWNMVLVLKVLRSESKESGLLFCIIRPAKSSWGSHLPETIGKIWRKCAYVSNQAAPVSWDRPHGKCSWIHRNDQPQFSAVFHAADEAELPICVRQYSEKAAKVIMWFLEGIVLKIQSPMPGI